MDNEEKVEQVLKLELGFDEEATKVIEEMKSISNAESTEKLISDALRVYHWYLQNYRNGLYTKRDESWVKVQLQI